MKYFRATFEYQTRPFFRKGRKAVQAITIAAADRTEAMRQAKRIGGEMWARRRWQLVQLEELGK